MKYTISVVNDLYDVEILEGQVTDAGLNHLISLFTTLSVSARAGYIAEVHSRGKADSSEYISNISDFTVKTRLTNQQRDD